MRRDGPLDSVASILTGLAHRLGIESQLLESRLSHRWSDIVGEQIAAHTRPDQIRFKKLYVYVRHSVWLQQLTFLKLPLLDKVNAAAGRTLVSELVLRIGDIAPPASSGKPSARGSVEIVEPSAQVRAEATEHAQAVQDATLRDHLAAVMAQALSRPARASMSRRDP